MVREQANAISLVEVFDEKWYSSLKVSTFSNQGNIKDVIYNVIGEQNATLAESGRAGI